MESRRGEEGQVLVIMATAMVFVLLAVAAVTMDIGNGLLEKRRLQNIADAAALAAASEIARGADDLAAATVAQNLVSTSTGGSVIPPYPAVGGVNLTNGIEISGGQVRVALRKTNVRTFFAGILGMNNLTVGARARAGANLSGILPIAVKRYSDGRTTSQLGSSEQADVLTSVDQLSRENSLTNTGSLVHTAWPLPWPSLLTQSVGPSYAATDVAKGAIIPILGGEASPNSDHPEFHYFVAPDVRNVTHPNPQYFNGVDPLLTSAQQLKNLEADYFLPGNMGYNSASLPQVEDQIAVMNGVITGTVVSRMKQYFPPGTSVAAMVYDGTVHSAPDFRLRIDSDYQYKTFVASPGSYSPASYTIILEQKSNPGLVNLVGLEFTVLGLEDSTFATYNIAGSGTSALVPVNGGNVSVTLTVTPQSGVTGAKTFVVKAHDPSTGITRTAAAAIIVGVDDIYYASSIYSGGNDSTYQKVEQNSNAGSFKFDIHGYNYASGPQTINASVDWLGSPHAGIDVICGSASGVKDNNSKTMTCSVTTQPGSATGEWLIKVTLSDGVPATDNQDVYLVLRVVSNLTNIANTTDFVYVLGYANFEICYWDGSFGHETPSHDNNTVFARAVSDIVDHPEDLRRARQVRLFSWN